ncbi:hypothetical protein FKZ61_007125 [Litorilinea aerophila]|uniref:DUF4015 domain-containing protein n=1 Tax=Litorilinea aerophila TaxID=1204385 RepID=A0A540VIR6_9CHLR|nr:hypothetical protein [Litorilinea aerophila]MCC9075879.1 hypothetical protein [Litorilinea aerophila]
MVETIAYGLDPQSPPFVGRPIPEVVQRLQELGCRGVFLKRLEQPWVEGLRAAGLRVYASCAIFLGSPELWQEMPAARPITDNGDPAPAEEWYYPALPTLPALRAARLERVEELARTLPLDGIWLDFIRWPARWERSTPRLYHTSFDPVTLAQFQQDTGIHLPPDTDTAVAAARWILNHAAEAWFGWRCRQIVSFVAEAARILHQLQPEALLGLFLVPWTGGPEDDLPMADAHIRIVGQDPRLLGQVADVLSPMVYHHLCGRSPSWAGQVTARVAAQANCAVWPVVEAIPGPAHQYPAAEFAQACASAATAGRQGLIVFNLAGLLEDPHKAAIWQELTQ